MEVLISLGTIASYVYSLAFCVMAGVLPDNSHPYFEVTGLIITLALLIELLTMNITRNKLQHQEHSQASALARTPSDSPTAADNGAASRQDTATSSDTRPNESSVSSRRLTRANRFIQIFVIASLVVSVWMFAIALVAGPQPRLANAIILTVSILALGGFLLAVYSIWELTRLERADRPASR